MPLRFRDCLEEQKRKRKKKCDEVHSHAFLMTSEQRFLFALLESSTLLHEMLPLDETHHMIVLLRLQFHDDR